MKKTLLIISSLFLLNFSGVFADCSLSTESPILTLSGENEMKIKFKTNGNCADSLNEFKVYYLKNSNYSPVSTIIPGENKEFYDIKWDISEIADGEYKIKIVQDGDQKTSTSSAFFTIDKTKPEIRDDFWILPTGGEILKGNIILKWNKDSVSDSYKLDSNPISFYYSFDGNNFEKIAENIENSGIYVWNSSELNSKKVFLKIVAKDLYGNEEFLVSENFFEIDNKNPAKLNFSKAGEENFSTEKRILNYTPKISVSGFDLEDGEVRVVIFDSKTEKIYGSSDNTEGEIEIQLDPLDDGDYELKILSIDKAGNKTESDDVLKIYRDAYSPKAPTISYAAIIKNSLRVTVSDFSEEDKETGTFILMNGTTQLAEQSSKENIFELDMLPQGVYDLYVKHRDLAGNLSDSSNIKKVIFDTVGPKEVTFSIPAGVSLYGDVDLNFFAVDNVGVEKVEIFVNSEKIGEAKDLKFILNTKNFSNGNHKIKAIAYDFAGNSTESIEKEFKVFNPLKENHWSNSYVKNLYDKGVLAGENNSGIIDPDSFLNKAKALKIVSEFFSDKIKDLGDKEILFSDVENGVWFEEYVQDGYKNKIISGNKKSKKLQEINLNEYDFENVENLQFLLKSLGYNLKISGNYDPETIRAVANYQNKNGLKPSGSLGETTTRFLNHEQNVLNGIVYEDEGIYFNPGKLINRAEVLKMILQAAKVEIENSEGIWYEKYLDFAKENGIISGKENGDFAMGDPVTVGEMSKMILKTKDFLDK